MFKKKNSNEVENKVADQEKAPKKSHRVLKIVGVVLLVCILFNIPISAINDIGKPSTNSDDHVKDYKVVSNDENETDINDKSDEETTEPEASDDSDSVKEDESPSDDSEVFGHQVADPSDANAVRDAANEWIDEGTSTEGSAFSAYDASLPISMNQIDMMDYYGSTDFYYYIENRTSEYIKQAIFFVYYWDENGMPIMVNPNGDDSVGGDQYVDVVVQNNLGPNESTIKEDNSIDLSYYDIYHIGVIPVAYETMEGNVWNNAYLTNFMEKSGSYVWEFRDVAQTAVFDFFNK